MTATGTRDPELAEINRALPMPDLLRALGVTLVHGGKGCHCPSQGHDDANASCQVHLDGVVCHGCGFSGDAIDVIAEVRGLSLREAKLEALAMAGMTERRPSGSVEDHWHRWRTSRHLGADTLERIGGKLTRWRKRPALIFPTPLGRDRVRFLDGEQPKTVWGRKVEGVNVGGGCWYGLGPSADLPGPLYIVNGEPSVWACHQAGVAAVCTCMAEAKRPSAERVRELAEAIGGREVRVVYDLDEAGRKGAAMMVEALTAAGIDARALALPAYLGDKGDVDDLHRRTGDAGLADALAGLPELDAKPPAPPDAPAGDLPVVQATTRVKEVVDAAAAALASHPAVYARHHQLVRIVSPEDVPGRAGNDMPPVIDPIPVETMREVLTEVAEWTRWDKREQDWVPCIPPDWATKAILARKQWPGVRVLRAIVESPTLRRDGSVVNESGYDAASGLFKYGDMRVAVPVSPTRQDVDRAVAGLLDLVCDFPFAEEYHRAGWLAGVLTLVGRYAFDGLSPMFFVDGNTRSAGKGKLADLIGIIGTGRELPKDAWSEDPEEGQKRLTTWVAEGRQIMCLDNQKGRLGGPALESALTSTVISGRVLGASRSIQGTMDMILFATANNATLTPDMVRRVIPIRIEAEQDRPEERNDFKYADVLGEAKRRRPELVGYALTILRAFILAGRPAPEGWKGYGSFEGWDRLIRHAVAFCGLEDPCKGQAAMEVFADPETNALRSLVWTWPTDHEGKPRKMKASDVVRYCEEHEGSPFAEAVNAFVTGKNLAKSLGRKLASMRRKRVDGRYLDGAPDAHDKVFVWTVDGAGFRQHPAGNPARNPAASDQGNQGVAGFAGFAGSDPTPMRAHAPAPAHTRATRGESLGDRGKLTPQTPQQPASQRNDTGKVCGVSDPAKPRNNPQPTGDKAGTEYLL